MAWQGDTAGLRTVKGEALQKARQRLYREQMARCAVCREIVMFGTKTFIRDHILALSEGGLDVRENTQGLCGPCSQRKTDAESKRGRARAAL